VDDEVFLREWVRPRAGEIDRDVGALREALEEMARRGLLGLRVPAQFGGRGLDERSFRRFQEASARASGALAFLESQHQSACALMVRAENAPLRGRLLPLLARGELKAGIAFSQLRRAGGPALRALPAPGGFRLEGALPWVTGWGLFAKCVTAATIPDGRTLFVLHDLAESPALRASGVLRLAAVEVAQTVSLELRGLFVPESDVLAFRPGTWIEENDRVSAALQSPLALGCAQAAIDIMEDEALRKESAAIRKAAERLSAELASCRHEAYAAMDDPSDPARNLAARARAIELAGRFAHAAVVASAGSGNLMDHPAQRVYREALAFSVLAINRPIQEAALARLAAR
jgi:alkylation response protein AidB-like acyl-CoA dehydrogenase